jgi:deazaflavin-dependent oxidoreductase (nitroreductase family)
MPDSYADFNAQIVDRFRTNGGAVGAPFEGKQLVLLHHVGRSSGRERVTPLVAATDGDAYLVCGTVGGAPQDPAWVANIEAGPGRTTIETGHRTVQARTTVVRPASPDWQRLYGIWSAYWPDSKEYETRTTRKFPIIRLEPLAPSASAD